MISKSYKKIFQIYRALKRGLSGEPSLQIIVQDGKPVIRGTLRRIEALTRLPERINSVVNFRWQVNISGSVAEKLKIWHRQLLKENALPDTELVFSPVLQAVIPDENKGRIARYKKLMSRFGIEVVRDPTILPNSPIIEISVVIAEVKKGFAQRIGVQWPGQIEAQLGPEIVWNSSSAPLVLHALESRGEGQILAAPTLLCRSGKKSTFFSGGEIPILSGNLGRNIVWKKHGIQIEFAPTLDVRGRLNLKIKAEISSPDFSRAVNGVPGFVTNQVNTDITMTRLHPIVISGLIRKDRSRNNEGLPILQRIPILGPLFGSRSFQNNESELVILVKPRILAISAEKIGALNVR